MEIKKAIIPAAGLGTRFLPATKAQPKEMLPIVDKPTIQFVVEEVLDSGIEDIIIVTGRGKRAIEDHFDKNIELEKYLKEKGEDKLLEDVERLSDLADLHFVRQKEQKGLGHAIYCARGHVGNEPFAVLLGDTIVENEIPCTKQLVNLYEKYKSSVIAVEEVPKERIDRYGVIGGRGIDEKTIIVDSLVEKPKPENAPSNLGIIGRYVLTPETFDAIENTEPGRGGEIQLTDALQILLKTQKMYGYKFDGLRYDIGDKIDYLRASIEYALRRDDLKKELKEYLDEIKL